MLTLLRNAAKCKKCNVVIESRDRDKYVTCNCGNVTITGGLNFTKVDVKKREEYADLCEWSQRFPETPKQEQA